jgi:uncharacterized membrane protein YhaH (DUF805 family)
MVDTVTDKRGKQLGSIENFARVIRSAYIQRTDFDGRASRAEFWWFFAFFASVGLILNLLWAVRGPVGTIGGCIALLFIVLNLLPLVALVTRRLHDTNRSGRWALLYFLPVIGSVVVICFLALPPAPERERISEL